jgi:hypothetical protein
MRVFLHRNHLTSARLTDEDRELVKPFINGLFLLSHEAKRLAA